MFDINETIHISDDEFEWSFVRSGGPGGQNVNKVASKAVLRWNVANSPSLPDEVKARFQAQHRQTHYGRGRFGNDFAALPRSRAQQAGLPGEVAWFVCAGAVRTEGTQEKEADACLEGTSPRGETPPRRGQDDAAQTGCGVTRQGAAHAVSGWVQPLTACAAP